MKKYLKSIVSMLFIVILIAGTACAEGDSMQADWRGDYTNMNLVLTVKAPVDYIQNVIVAMYPKDETPGIEAYSRVDEVTVDGKNEKEVIFKIADDLTAPDGLYTVKFYGNGAYDNEKNSATIDVYVMTPTNVATLLANINGASADTAEGLSELKGYMSQAAGILQLDGIDTAGSDRLLAIVNIRDLDYSTNNNKFYNLNDVEKAWRVSGLIACLAQSTVNGTELEAEYSALTDILSVNMTDDDYNNLKTDIYNNIIDMKKLANDGKGVQSRKNAEDIFNQAKAIAVINSSAIDDLEAAVAKYYNELGIDASTYEKFSDYSDTDKQKVLRQLYDQAFKSVEDINYTFDTAVRGIVTEEKGSSSSGGGGGGSVGGLGGVQSDVATTVPQTPSVSGGFSDLATDHWAYSYVQELKTEGIISGYSDGNFYPNRSVSREEFVKMIVLSMDMYSEGQDCNYYDVSKDEWYFTYIASASQSGLVNGIGDGLFGIGKNITREDVAVIVNRILAKHDVTVSGSVQNYTDAAEISDYAFESVNALSALGILNGFEDGSFKPQAALSRAEAAKIICLFREYINQ